MTNLEFSHYMRETLKRKQREMKKQYSQMHDSAESQAFIQGFGAAVDEMISTVNNYENILLEKEIKQMDLL